MRRIFIFISCLMSLSAAASKIDIHRWQTNKGSQVLFVQATELPMVDISIAFPAGSAYDDQHWGLASLTASLINQGTNKLNATQIAEQFENVGAVFSGDVDKDTAQFSLRSLSYKTSLKPAVKTLKTILSQASFPLQSFQREKEQQLTTIHYMAEKPGSLASNIFYELLYPKHPYGHNTLGTNQTVSHLKREQAANFFRTHYVANKAIIAITGDLSLAEAQTLSSDISNTFNTSDNKQNTDIPIISRAQKAQNKTINFPSNQTNILIGQVGITHDNLHYFPLIVGNYTLGGSGLISRLATEVRENRGLTYGVYSSFQTMLSPGPFSIRLATQTAKTHEALQVTLDTFERFLETGPQQSELDAAKQYMVGSFPLRLNSNKSINSTILNMGIYKLPEDYLDTYLDNINAVKKEQIKTAFNETIDPNALITVTVGK